MSELGPNRLHFEASTIETIDTSVFDYVRGLELSTVTNKGYQKVPVVWGTAERSFQVKKDADIRDKQGLLVLPIISIKRETFQKPAASPGAFQGTVPPMDEERGGSLTTSRVLYHEKTLKFANADSYRLFGQKNSTAKSPKLVYRAVMAPMPVNVEITYKIVLRTEYQEQMNDLMAPFLTKSGTVRFVRLRHNEHKYEGFLQEAYASSDNLSDFSSDERKFQTEVTLRVVGYLVGEGKNRDKPSYSIVENAVDVKIPRERISLGEIPANEYGSYHGISALPLSLRDRFSKGSFFTNVPAASFFGGAAGSAATGDASSNVVTSENFSEVLSQNIVVDEVLLDGNTAPPASKTFITQFNIRDNTERVTIQGLAASRGTGPGDEYTIQGANKVVFNENILVERVRVVITYIKG